MNTLNGNNKKIQSSNEKDCLKAYDICGCRIRLNPVLAHLKEIPELKTHFSGEVFLKGFKKGSERRPWRGAWCCGLRNQSQEPRSTSNL